MDRDGQKRMKRKRGGDHGVRRGFTKPIYHTNRHQFMRGMILSFTLNKCS